MAEKCVCEVCQNEFPEGTELFPKLIVTRDERVARELMDDKRDVRLCLKCWFEDVKKIPSEDLAMATLALLKKVRSMEGASKSWTDVIEKMKQPQPTMPWVQPTWIGPHTIPNTAGKTPDMWYDDNSIKPYIGTPGIPDGWTHTSAHGSDRSNIYIGTMGNVQGMAGTGNQEKPKINP